MKGAFIAIEGIDGCGKGTVIKRLATDLFEADKNNHIFLTREPYQRDWLKKFLSRLDPISQGEDALKLFVEDRTKHCKMIEACTKKGIIVLSDRYKHSTYAYQMAQGIPFEKIHAAHQGLIVPDLAIIIDLPVAEAVRRMTEGREQDAHAFHKEDFLLKVRENYLKLPELLKENIVFIDGNRDRESVCADALRIASDHLKKAK
jgi:dTMP kinase